MKYILIIGDGMADDPLPELGGKTPLEVCNKPFFDSLSERGRAGPGPDHTRGLSSRQ